jgi:hypothetical protein
VITDTKHDDLHREVYPTQGKLSSCFGYDPRARKGQLRRLNTILKMTLS